MELRIEPYKSPEQILFNYEELKAALIEKCAVYETMVYTEDQIKDAKSDRANLNRLKKALNDERLKREREYMASFNVFKGQVAEIIGIIDKSVTAVDKQVKNFEEQQKEKKLEAILNYYNSKELPVDISPTLILDEKWLNASVKMATIEKEIDAKFEQIEKDLAVLGNLPSHAFEAREVYIHTLDLGKAVTEANRLREVAEKKAAWEAEQAKKKDEAETKIAQSPATTFEGEPINAEPQKQWIGFKALLSVEDAKALKEFFLARGIQYKSI